MPDTAAALAIQVSADISALRREMRAATGVFDAEGRKIEQRQQRLRQNLEKGFAGMGRSLTAILSIGAVTAFARNLLNTADALADTSAQLGVTVQDLQGLDYAARVSGASSEKLAQALSFLADGLGAAQKGEGEMAKAMRESGVQMGTTLDVLYDVANRVKAATTETEKMNIATTYLGAKGGKTMVSFLNQGAAGLRKLQEEASAKGQIWDAETLGRLDQAKDSFETLKKSFVGVAALPASAFMTQLANVLDMLAGGSWQKGIDSLMEAAPTLAGVAGGFVVGGPVGAVAGGIAGNMAGRVVRPGIKILDATGPLPGEKAPGGGGRSAVPQSTADRTSAALADARRVAEISQILSGAYEDRARAYDDYKDTIFANTRSEQEDLIARSRGWSDFAKVQEEAIQRITDADLGSAKVRADAAMQALEARQFEDIQALIANKATKEQMVELDRQYEEQRNLIQNQASAEAVEIRRREASDIAQIQTDQIQISDNIRDSMVEIGTAALHGFGDMKDAAARALDQIAEMILQMYVLKPLVESILGKPGTSGGGWIGSLLDFVPKFANGTNNAPGGMALVGERGPELVNLPRGSQVIPNISRSGGGTTVVAPVINIDARYATRGVAEEVESQLRASAPRIVSAALQAQPQRAASFQKLGT